MSRPITTAHERADALAKLVGERVTAVQRGYLAGTMAAQANLAKLRRALGQPAGSSPDVWELTIAGVETIEVPPRDGSPSRAEKAVHLAMTLYALNQRSVPVPTHLTRPGPADLDRLDEHEQHKKIAGYRDRAGLGRACARLRSASHFNEDAVIRRFAALATAQSFDEITYHLRSMVSQFNAESIGLDYGRLARDLYLLQFDAYADSVRLGWARDFHRYIEHPIAGSADNTDDTESAADDGATDKAGTHA
jgi:CRISPR system Cascade subunit CasB